MNRRFAHALRRFDEAELGICRYLNRGSEVEAVGALFALVSRLGDGWLWYALILLLPFLYGREGLALAAQMAATGAAGLLLYNLIKSRAVRERPYVTHRAISCITAPMDRYSFPSGHTLHAVSFTLLVSTRFPEWTPSLSFFALLVALSRVVLGLHYPTDVAAGALLGAALAALSLAAGGWLGVA